MLSRRPRRGQETAPATDARRASTGPAQDAAVRDRAEERGRRLESEEDLAAAVRGTETIAVIGMKGEDRIDQAAYAGR